MAAIKAEPAIKAESMVGCNVAKGKMQCKAFDSVGSDTPWPANDKQGGVRKSTRPRKQSKKALSLLQSTSMSHDDDDGDDNNGADEPHVKTACRKRRQPRSVCTLCGKLLPKRVRSKKGSLSVPGSGFPIGGSSNLKVADMKSMCSICQRILERQKKAHKPSKADREQFESEGLAFGEHLANTLKDPEAKRLYCPFYQVHPCGCIQKYISGKLPGKKKRNKGKILLEGTVDLQVPVESSDLRERGLFLLSLRKESLNERSEIAEARRQKRKMKDKTDNDLKFPQEFTHFLLSRRLVLKEAGLCERGCQRVLGYSNNFLHKKVNNGPRLAPSKGKAVGTLIKFEDFAGSNCCRNMCVKMAESKKELLEVWKQEAAKSQKKSREVIMNMLTPNEKKQANCPNFAAMVTGSCKSTVMKIKTNMILNGGGKPLIKREKAAPQPGIKNEIGPEEGLPKPKVARISTPISGTAVSPRPALPSVLAPGAIFSLKAASVSSTVAPLVKIPVPVIPSAAKVLRLPAKTLIARPQLQPQLQPQPQRQDQNKQFLNQKLLEDKHKKELEELKRKQREEFIQLQQQQQQQQQLVQCQSIPINKGPVDESRSSILVPQFVNVAGQDGFSQTDLGKSSSPVVNLAPHQGGGGGGGGGFVQNPAIRIATPGCLPIKSNVVVGTTASFLFASPTALVQGKTTPQLSMLMKTSSSVPEPTGTGNGLGVSVLASGSPNSPRVIPTNRTNKSGSSSLGLLLNASPSCPTSVIGLTCLSNTLGRTATNGSQALGGAPESTTVSASIINPIWQSEISSVNPQAVFNSAIVPNSFAITTQDLHSGIQTSEALVVGTGVNLTSQNLPSVATSRSDRLLLPQSKDRILKDFQDVLNPKVSIAAPSMLPGNNDNQTPASLIGVSGMTSAKNGTDLLPVGFKVGLPASDLTGVEVDTLTYSNVSLTQNTTVVSSCTTQKSQTDIRPLNANLEMQSARSSSKKSFPGGNTKLSTSVPSSSPSTPNVAAAVTGQRESQPVLVYDKSSGTMYCVFQGESQIPTNGQGSTTPQSPSLSSVMSAISSSASSSSLLSSSSRLSSDFSTLELSFPIQGQPKSSSTSSNIPGQGVALLHLDNPNTAVPQQQISAITLTAATGGTAPGAVTSQSGDNVIAVQSSDIPTTQMKKAITSTSSQITSEGFLNPNPAAAAGGVGSFSSQKIRSTRDRSQPVIGIVHPHVTNSQARQGTVAGQETGTAAPSISSGRIPSHAPGCILEQSHAAAVARAPLSMTMPMPQERRGGSLQSGSGSSVPVMTDVHGRVAGNVHPRQGTSGDSSTNPNQAANQQPLQHQLVLPQGTFISSDGTAFTLSEDQLQALLASNGQQLVQQTGMQQGGLAVRESQQLRPTINNQGHHQQLPSGQITSTPIVASQGPQMSQGLEMYDGRRHSAVLPGEITTQILENLQADVIHADSIHIMSRGQSTDSSPSSGSAQQNIHDLQPTIQFLSVSNEANGIAQVIMQPGQLNHQLPAETTVISSDVTPHSNGASLAEAWPTSSLTKTDGTASYGLGRPSVPATFTQTVPIENSGLATCHFLPLPSQPGVQGGSNTSVSVAENVVNRNVVAQANNVRPQSDGLNSNSSIGTVAFSLPLASNGSATTRIGSVEEAANITLSQGICQGQVMADVHHHEVPVIQHTLDQSRMVVLSLDGKESFSLPTIPSSSTSSSSAFSLSSSSSSLFHNSQDQLQRHQIHTLVAGETASTSSTSQHALSLGSQSSGSHTAIPVSTAMHPFLQHSQNGSTSRGGAPNSSDKLQNLSGPMPQSHAIATDQKTVASFNAKNIPPSSSSNIVNNLNINMSSSLSSGSFAMTSESSAASKQSTKRSNGNTVILIPDKPGFPSYQVTRLSPEPEGQALTNGMPNTSSTTPSSTTVVVTSLDAATDTLSAVASTTEASKQETLLQLIAQTLMNSNQTLTTGTQFVLPFPPNLSTTTPSPLTATSDSPSKQRQDGVTNMGSSMLLPLGVQQLYENVKDPDSLEGCAAKRETASNVVSLSAISKSNDKLTEQPQAFSSFQTVVQNLQTKSSSNQDSPWTGSTKSVLELSNQDSQWTGSTKSVLELSKDRQDNALNSLSLDVARNPSSSSTHIIGNSKIGSLVKTDDRWSVPITVATAGVIGSNAGTLSNSHASSSTTTTNLQDTATSDFTNQQAVGNQTSLAASPSRAGIASHLASLTGVYVGKPNTPCAGQAIKCVGEGNAMALSQQTLTTISTEPGISHLLTGQGLGAPGKDCSSSNKSVASQQSSSLSAGQVAAQSAFSSQMTTDTQQVKFWNTKEVIDVTGDSPPPYPSQSRKQDGRDLASTNQSVVLNGSQSQSSLPTRLSTLESVAATTAETLSGNNSRTSGDVTPSGDSSLKELLENPELAAALIRLLLKNSNVTVNIDGGKDKAMNPSPSSNETLLLGDATFREVQKTSGQNEADPCTLTSSNSTESNQSVTVGVGSTHMDTSLAVRNLFGQRSEESNNPSQSSVGVSPGEPNKPQKTAAQRVVSSKAHGDFNRTKRHGSQSQVVPPEKSNVPEGLEERRRSRSVGTSNNLAAPTVSRPHTLSMAPLSNSAVPFIRGTVSTDNSVGPPNITLVSPTSIDRKRLQDLQSAAVLSQKYDDSQVAVNAPVAATLAPFPIIDGTPSGQQFSQSTTRLPPQSVNVYNTLPPPPSYTESSNLYLTELANVNKVNAERNSSSSNNNNTCREESMPNSFLARKMKKTQLPKTNDASYTSIAGKSLSNPPAARPSPGHAGKASEKVSSAKPRRYSKTPTIRDILSQQNAAALNQTTAALNQTAAAPSPCKNNQMNQIIFIPPVTGATTTLVASETQGSQFLSTLIKPGAVQLSQPTQAMLKGTESNLIYGDVQKNFVEKDPLTESELRRTNDVDGGGGSVQVSLEIQPRTGVCPEIKERPTLKKNSYAVPVVGADLNGSNPANFYKHHGGGRLKIVEERGEVNADQNFPSAVFTSPSAKNNNFAASISMDEVTSNALRCSGNSHLRKPTTEGCNLFSNSDFPQTASFDATKKSESSASSRDCSVISHLVETSTSASQATSSFPDAAFQGHFSDRTNAQAGLHTTTTALMQRVKNRAEPPFGLAGENYPRIGRNECVQAREFSQRSSVATSSFELPPQDHRLSRELGEDGFTTSKPRDEVSRVREISSSFEATTLPPQQAKKRSHMSHHHSVNLSYGQDDRLLEGVDSSPRKMVVSLDRVQAFPSSESHYAAHHHQHSTPAYGLPPPPMSTDNAAGVIDAQERCTETLLASQLASSNIQNSTPLLSSILQASPNMLRSRVHLQVQEENHHAPQASSKMDESWREGGNYEATSALKSVLGKDEQGHPHVDSLGEDISAPTCVPKRKSVHSYYNYVPEPLSVGYSEIGKATGATDRITDRIIDTMYHKRDDKAAKEVVDFGSSSTQMTEPTGRSSSSSSSSIARRRQARGSSQTSEQRLSASEDDLQGLQHSLPKKKRSRRRTISDNSDPDSLNNSVEVETRSGGGGKRTKSRKDGGSKERKKGGRFCPSNRFKPKRVQFSDVVTNKRSQASASPPTNISIALTSSSGTALREAVFSSSSANVLPLDDQNHISKSSSHIMKDEDADRVTPNSAQSSYRHARVHTAHAPTQPSHIIYSGSDFPQDGWLHQSSSSSSMEDFQRTSREPKDMTDSPTHMLGRQYHRPVGRHRIFDPRNESEMMMHVGGYSHHGDDKGLLIAPRPVVAEEHGNKASPVFSLQPTGHSPPTYAESERRNLSDASFYPILSNNYPEEPMSSFEIISAPGYCKLSQQLKRKVCATPTVPHTDSAAVHGGEGTSSSYSAVSASLLTSSSSSAREVRDYLTSPWQCTSSRDSADLDKGMDSAAVKRQMALQSDYKLAHQMLANRQPHGVRSRHPSLEASHQQMLPEGGSPSCHTPQPQGLGAPLATVAGQGQDSSPPFLDQTLFDLQELTEVFLKQQPSVLESERRLLSTLQEHIQLKKAVAKATETQCRQRNLSAANGSKQKSPASSASASSAGMGGVGGVGALSGGLAGEFDFARRYSTSMPSSPFEQADGVRRSPRTMSLGKFGASVASSSSSSSAPRSRNASSHESRSRNASGSFGLNQHYGDLEHHLLSDGTFPRIIDVDPALGGRDAYHHPHRFIPVTNLSLSLDGDPVSGHVDGLRVRGYQDLEVEGHNRHRNLSSSSLKSSLVDIEQLEHGSRSRNPSTSSLLRYIEHGGMRSRNPSGSSNRRSRPGSCSSDRDFMELDMMNLLVTGSPLNHSWM